MNSEGPYLLLPDVDTAVNFLELFETLNITGLVIAQTILDALDNEIQVANRKAIIRRLRRLASDKRRSSVVFPNEFFSSTHYDAPAHQPALQRRDFAVAKLASWLTAHTSKHRSLSSSTPIIFITDKKDVSEWAQSQGVKDIVTMSQFIERFFGDKELKYFETLRQVALDAAERRQRLLLPNKLGVDNRNPFEEYTEYLSEEALDAGIKSGLYFTGKLQVSSQSVKEAVVKLRMPYGVTTAIVPGEYLRNRAFHGDRVVVVTVPAEDVWKSLNRYHDMKGPFARVVGVQTPSRRKFVCTVQEEDSATAGSGQLIAVPWDRRVPKIRIKSRQYSELVNGRLLIQVDFWDVDSRMPSGHYVSTLGEIGLHESEMQVLLHESEIDTAPFAPAILEELPKSWQATHNDPRLGPRRDITDWRIYSIDPPGCQDIDDALSYRKLPDGTLQVGVHIADVAAFVEEGSKLDVEARARGTSVYLPDRRIDMLPTLLSERLCSIRCGEPRYAVSVIWHLDSAGNILETWHGRTLIKTAHELCYADAQAIMDDKTELRSRFADYDLLREELLGLRAIFHRLRDVRQANGALDLETVEVSFVLDAETKRPQKVATKESLEVHALVAEFMIFANCAVAEFLARNLPHSAMLRRHPLPNANNFGEVIELARSRGIEMDFSSNYALAQSLNRAERLGDRMFTFTLRNLTTLAMAEAEYMSSGSVVGPEEFYHYGLAVEFYTHFTSPIRRYADLVVHRQLLAILAERDHTASFSPSYTPSNYDLQAVAEHLNFRNRQAKEVQRNSKGLYQNMYFSTRENKDSLEVGVVVAIKPSSLVLYFPKYGYNCHLSLKDSSNSESASEESDKAQFASDAFPFMRTDGSSETTKLDGGNGKECVLDSFERSENETEMVLKTPSGSHTVHLFDCITAKIGVSTNRYHMEKVKLSNVRFQSMDYEKLENRYYGSKDASSPQAASSSSQHSITTAEATLPAIQSGSIDSTQSNTKSTSSNSQRPLSAKTMINEVRKAEQSAKDKIAEEKMNMLPDEVKALAKSSVSALYRWCQFESDAFPLLTKMDIARAYASFVLSRRALQSRLPSASPASTKDVSKGTKLCIKKPVCIYQRKRMASGRRTWKEEEYLAQTQLSKVSILDDYEEEEEERHVSEALSAVIPGISFGPSASFGSTNVTYQSQAARLNKAQAHAEQEFKKQQAQVNKAKYASRHY